MFKQFLVCVLLAAANVASAQRVPTSPDLSAVTRRGSGAVSLDPKTGFIYARFYGDRAMGIASSGLARVSPAGVIDAYWRPTGMSYPEKHVVAASGDVYVVSRGGSNGSELLRYSGTRGGEPLNRYPPANSAPSSLALATGGDPWVYVTTSELDTGTASTKRLQVNRIDTRTGALDAQWTYDEAYSVYSSVATGSDGSVFLIGVNAVARLSTSGRASLLWRQRFADRVYASTPDTRGGLFVRVCREYSDCTSGGVISRFTPDGVLDAS